MSADSNGRPWDWSDDDDDVVVPEQPAIACYTNPTGAVVLRQRGAWNDDDDAWIWFSPEHARAIANAILEVAGYEFTAPVPKPDGNKSKDGAAAERQRRYRERKKKEATPEHVIFDRDDHNDRDVTDRETVTPRNGVTA